MLLVQLGEGGAATGHVIACAGIQVPPLFGLISGDSKMDLRSRLIKVMDSQRRRTLLRLQHFFSAALLRAVHPHQECVIAVAVVLS